MLRAKYEEAKTDAEEVLPAKFVVNSAYQAERKSYPIRWLIVMVTTLSAFLFTLIILLIIENINTYFPGSINLNGLQTRAKDDSEKIAGKDPPPPPREPPQKGSAGKTNDNIPAPAPVSENPGKNKSTEFRDTNHQDQSITKQKNETGNSIDEGQTIKETTEIQDSQMAKYFTNTNILKLLFKWKFHLGAIVLLGVILATIFSSPWFITPKYKSYALVYPSNIQPYSDESESEQMLQFMQSNDIRDKMIRMYDLPSRYDIDTNYKYYKSTIDYLYSKNVMVSKTPFESIKIEVMDADPQVACDMVNSIIDLYNQKILKIQRQKYKQVLDIETANLNRKQQEIDSVEAILHNIHIEYGIIDYPNQSREVARGFLRTVDGDNAAQNINTREVLKLKENIEQHGAVYTYYNDRYFDLIEEYSRVKMGYDHAVANYKKDITFADILSTPYPADKKAYPVRWVIVVLTALGVWFASFLTILFIENYESIRRNF